MLRTSGGSFVPGTYWRPQAASDLIEGYTKDEARMAAEWREFQSYVHRLQMPFFYVPGNHDMSNPAMARR